MYTHQKRFAWISDLLNFFGTLIGFWKDFGRTLMTQFLKNRSPFRKFNPFHVNFIYFSSSFTFSMTRKGTKINSDENQRYGYCTHLVCTKYFYFENSSVERNTKWKLEESPEKPMLFYVFNEIFWSKSFSIRLWNEERIHPPPPQKSFSHILLLLFITF